MRSFTFVAILSINLMPLAGFAGAAVTYHGRILDSQERPVETQSVVFKIQVRSPGATDCLLFEETRTVDMRGSSGVFVIPIGDGQGHRSGSDPGITVENVFSNNPALDHTGLSCNSNNHYQPQTLDSRKLVVSFDDGSGSGAQVLPPMDVNYVPLALHAQESVSALNVGATPAARVMSVASGAATPLSAANFSELMLLVNANSSAYVKTSALPSCAAGEVLKAMGGALVCVTDNIGTDSDLLAGITCPDGKILKRVSGNWACADESGVGTETDPTVKAYSKQDPGTGLVVASGDHLSVDFGAGAGKAVEGSDSRLSDARAPNGSATGDLSGSYPNPTVKGIRGNAVNASAPADAQVYKWVTGSSEFQPKYVGLADLRKSDGSPQIPQCNANANETLIYTSVSDTFTCTAINNLDAGKITSGILSASRLPTDTMILTCADGKIAKRVAGAWACADDVGVGSEVDPSVAAYAKNAPATGLLVNGSNKIAPDFGTGAGKVVEGNDSRLSDNRVASDLNSVVSTGIVQRTGAGSFATLGTSAPVGISAGNIGLSIGGGLTLTTGNLVPDFGTASGKVAQGDDSRFPSSACSSGSYSRWTGSAWACDVAAGGAGGGLAQKQYFTSSGTFTVPTGVTTVRVTVAGGGGGGAGSTNNPQPKAADGGTSSVTKSGVSVSAAGGVGGYGHYYPGGASSRTTNAQTLATASATGASNSFVIPGGGARGGMAGMWSTTFTGGWTDAFENGQPGANGGLVVADITTTPGESLTVTVGAGGAADANGSAGAGGHVIFEWTGTGTTVASSGSGTSGTLAQWTSASALSDSPISVNGANIGIGTASPAAKLEVVGQAKMTGLVFAPQASAPSSPVEGTVYYDSTIGLRMWDGSNWRTVAAKVQRTITGFTGALGPDLSTEGYTQCYGWANDGTTNSSAYSTFRANCGAGTTVLFAGYRSGSSTLIRHEAPLGQQFVNFLPTSLPGSSTYIDSFDINSPKKYTLELGTPWIVLGVNGNRWADPGRLWEPSFDGAGAGATYGHVLSQDGNNGNDQQTLTGDQYFLYIKY